MFVSRGFVGESFRPFVLLSLFLIKIIFSILHFIRVLGLFLNTYVILASIRFWMLIFFRYYVIGY